MKHEHRGAGEETRAEWPSYLEPLRPDEVTRHRIRKGVLGAAEAIFERRAGTWFDVTATWSSVLAPVAAALLVVFGTLAYRATSTTPEAAELAAISEPAGLVRSLAPDAIAPPALLIDADEPSRDAVLAAVLVDDR